MNKEDFILESKKRIKKNEYKAFNHIKKAEVYEDDAQRFEKEKNIESAAKNYYKAAKEYFHTCIDLDFNRWELINLNLKNDERLVELTDQLKEKHLKSAENYEKSAKCYKELNKVDILSELYGMTAKQYVGVFDLMDEKEIKEECLESGKVYSFSETIPGKIVDAYRNATRNFYDVAEKFEMKGETKKASFFYGVMGDAHLNIAILYEKIPKGHLFFNKYYEAEHYFYAAECYKKAKELNDKTGIPTVIEQGRLIWKYSLEDMHSLFKDSKGHTIIDDGNRAVIIYEKAKEIYNQQNEKINVKRCEQRIKEFKSLPVRQLSSIFNIDIEPETGKIALKTINRIDLDKIIEIQDGINKIFGKELFIQDNKMSSDLSKSSNTREEFKYRVQNLALWIDKIKIDNLKEKIDSSKLVDPKGEEIKGSINVLQIFLQDNGLEEGMIIENFRDIVKLRNGYPTHKGKADKKAENVLKKWGFNPYNPDYAGLWQVTLNRYSEALKQLHEQLIEFNKNTTKSEKL